MHGSATQSRHLRAFVPLDSAHLASSITEMGASLASCKPQTSRTRKTTPLVREWSNVQTSIPFHELI